jgi:hypothetical protein
MAANALTVTQGAGAASLTQSREPEMDDDEILALIEEEIAVSVSFDNDPEEDSREVALEYYDARRSRMNKDVPHVDGWSQINAKTVSETVDLALPGIMRVLMRQIWPAFCRAGRATRTTLSRRPSI